MVFRQGQKVEIFKRSADESWESYMDAYIGLHGIITDPDSTINDPDASYTPPPQLISYNCFNKVSSITDTLSVLAEIIV